jgi:hypothetical protein
MDTPGLRTTFVKRGGGFAQHDALALSSIVESNGSAGPSRFHRLGRAARRECPKWLAFENFVPMELSSSMCNPRKSLMT